MLPDVFVETVAIDESGQSSFRALHQGSFETNLSGHEQGTEFRCVRLRMRALNGTYSEPVKACRADYGPPVEIRARAIACGAITESTVVEQDVSMEASTGEGCSVSRSSQSAALNLLIALATLLLSGRQRRDAPRNSA